MKAGTHAPVCTGARTSLAALCSPGELLKRGYEGSKVRVLPTAICMRPLTKLWEPSLELSHGTNAIPPSSRSVIDGFLDVDHSDRRYLGFRVSDYCTRVNPFPILCWPMINMDVWNSLTEEGAGLDYRGLVMMPQWPSAPISVRMEVFLRKWKRKQALNS